MSDLSGGSSGLPPADWYADPSNPRQQRWWTGAGWTEHVRAVVPAPAASAVPEIVSPATVDPAPVSPALFAPVGREPAVFAPTPAPFQTGQPFWAETSVEKPAPTGSATTLAVWLIAASPAIFALAFALVLTFDKAPVNVIPLIAVPIGMLLLPFFLGYWDNVVLVRRGLPVATVWWMLLAVVAYLIARHVALLRAGRSSVAPFVLYLVLVPAVLVGLALPTYFNERVPNQAPESAPARDATPASDQTIPHLEKEIAQQFDQQSTATWTVHCPVDAPVAKAGETFTCTAVGLPSHTTIPVKVGVTAPYKFKLLDIGSEGGPPPP